MLNEKVILALILVSGLLNVILVIALIRVFMWLDGLTKAYRETLVRSLTIVEGDGRDVLDA